MVQTIMLLVLGFLLATLIFLLLAPVVWRRAGRLATKRLKESLPISLTDFHAEKDQLRANHAISIRGLEVILDQAKERNAQQMVDIGRQRADNMSLTGQIRKLRSALSERKSLISVMEQTLNANVPRMKERMASELSTNIKLSDTVVELKGSLKKTAHQLEAADRDIKLREAEIHKLRQNARNRPHASAVFPFGRSRKESVMSSGNRLNRVELAALDLVEGEKGAAAVQSLQQENHQLREIIARTKAQLASAKSFEAREVPALRKELRQLGAEVLRKVDVPKIDKKVKFPPLTPLTGKIGGADINKAKRSLADRLKNISKLGGEVDA